MTGEHSAEIIARWIGSDIPAGDLQNSEWQDARPIAITRHWSGEPAPAGRHAEARILWSNEALYVRFFCNQGEPLVVEANPQIEKKTIGLWDRDVCEIFIAPDANLPERYFEFEAAPTGEWVDLGVHWKAGQRETDWDFDSGMAVGALVEKDHVVIAMRIPWSDSGDSRDSIPKPRRGDRWRANLFRCAGTGESRYLAWQPTRTAEPDFHVPQAFGWLRFT